MHRLAALIATGGVVLAGLAGVPAAQGGTDRAVVDQAVVERGQVRAHPGYQPPRIRWSPCTKRQNPNLHAIGAQCGRLVVPLDYRKPHGRKISLAVSRVKHRSSRAHYQGVMLTNPGGPGGSGLILSILGYGPIVPGQADDDYDWIGFDPRGVGLSRPALTCNAAYFHYDRPAYVPSTRRLERTWLTRSRRYARQCGRARASRLLEHVKTRDTVADMESLRKALGKKRINFYGFSYGTYLGQVYATLHPRRVRRFVLDSNVDPRGVWYRDNLAQDVAFDKNIQIFFDWVAKHDDVYRLGTDGSTIEKGYYDELAKLDRRPAGGVIGPDELADVLLGAGYGVSGWEDIAQAYSALVNHGDFSRIKQQYDDANPQVPGGDNGYAMYLATQCSDVHWPKSWQRWRNDNWRVYSRAPFLTWANAWFNAPCVFWPAGSGRPVHVTGARVKRPILLIDETHDAATPFAGSLEVRRRFPTSALIEGVGGTTHAASLSGVACVDDAIAAYLAHGTLPARTPGRHSDRKCPPVPQPEPKPVRTRAGGNPAQSQAQSQAEARAQAPARAALLDAVRSAIRRAAVH